MSSTETKIKLRNGKEVIIPAELKTVGEIIGYCRQTYKSLPSEGPLGTLASILEGLEQVKKEKDAQKAAGTAAVLKARLGATMEMGIRTTAHPVCKACIGELEKVLQRKRFADFEFYWTEETSIGKTGCSCEIVLWLPDVRRPSKDFQFGFWANKFYMTEVKEVKSG